MANTSTLQPDSQRERPISDDPREVFFWSRFAVGMLIAEHPPQIQTRPLRVRFTPEGGDKALAFEIDSDFQKLGVNPALLLGWRLRCLALDLVAWVHAP